MDLHKEIKQEKRKRKREPSPFPFPVLERVTGIEPVLSGRKHDILPLNYTRV